MSEQRRLAAILVADVVGYSKLVGSDEAGTLAQLQALRSDIIDAQITKHAGRLFKSVGDGFLVEFASAVQAVACAKAIQEANAGGGLPLRIGIHVGDVVVQGDDLMGDGVNIAARIEGVAEVGGIAISRAVHEQVRDKLDVSFVDKGEIALKNLARPVQVFALGGAASSSAVEPAPALPLPDKPSIAVLPFQNMSGDPEQEYFVDGLVEDIITGLSRNRGLFVIARNSSFTYKGKAVDVRQVGRELGVRYVLEGSVRKAANRIRITGQLIDAQSNAHLWADRFDGALEDVFELQDQVTGRVVSSIGPTVMRAEMERSSRKPTEILQAYDLNLRASAHFYKFSKEGSEKSISLLKQATMIDPNYARAFVMLASTYAVRRAMTWTSDFEGEAALAEQFVRRALELDSRDAFVLSRAGSVLAYVLRRVEESAGVLDRALELDPNDANAWSWRGWAYYWLKAPQEAIKRYEHALRLNPLDPQIVFTHTGMAYAHLSLDWFAEAETWAKKALHELPKYPAALRALVAIQALAGNVEEARRTLQVYLQIDPTMRLSNMGRRYFVNYGTAGLDRFSTAYRLAGLPE